MAHHGLPIEEEVLQQMISEECFWLAPGHPAISSLADSASNYAAFLDYSHRLSQQDWLRPTNSIPQDFQTAVLDQSGAAFLFHENNCTLLASRQDRPNYRESSCSSSSASSANYSRDKARDRQSPEESSTTDTNKANEPENLSARKLQDDSLPEEKSTTPKNSEDETEFLNPSNQLFHSITKFMSSNS